jgi:dTMP kinase
MTETRRGLFITFEGTEGSGKTTQMRLLTERLRQAGYPVTENQEPGATAIGRQIRRIFLDPVHDEMAPMTELLLVFASRAQAAADIIAPALDRGDVVVSDRFTDSTLAYQGQARGIGFEKVCKIHELALGSLRPDVTFCLTIDVEAGLARAQHRNQSDTSEARFDQQSVEFHRRVSEGYRRIAAAEPDRVHMVDARGEPQAVAERVWAELAPRLPK